MTYVAALLYALLALLLAGCSNDNMVEEAEADAIGNQLQLRIVMKSQHAGTRAVTTADPTGGEIGDGLRAGNYNENNIYTIYLYQYNSPQGINAPDDTPVNLLAFDENVNFKPTAGDVKPDKSIEKIVELNVGAYRYQSNDHYIAVVNSKLYRSGITLGELRNEILTFTWQQSGSDAKSCDMFAMSNANDSRFEGGLGTKADPMIVAVDVERTAARIDFAYSQDAMDAGKFRIAGGKYIYKVEDTNDEVYLSHVRATNVKQQGSYLIKRLAESESATPVYLADETNPASKYVVEPHTWTKSLAAMENGTLPLSFWYGSSWYGNAVGNHNSVETPWFTDKDRVHIGSGNAFTDGTTLDEEERDWHYYILTYANENTMRAAETLHNYTTGLILKATYSPEFVYGSIDVNGVPVVDGTYSMGTTFWRWHDIDTNADRYFSNKAAAEAYQALHPHSIVFEYADGQCYYNVWLRHENIVNDPTTTMMEFGIVRNNIYRVCVEFTGIGMPDIPDDMTTAESIRMFIYVRKWNLISHPTIEI